MVLPGTLVISDPPLRTATLPNAERSCAETRPLNFPHAPVFTPAKLQTYKLFLFSMKGVRRSRQDHSATDGMAGFPGSQLSPDFSPPRRADEETPPSLFLNANFLRRFSPIFFPPRFARTFHEPTASSPNASVNFFILASLRFP